jgi:hypothetical protein
MIFPDTITIFEMVEDVDQCGVDGHGKPRTCPVQTSETMGMFQPVRPSETMFSPGNVNQGDYNLYLPINTEITSSSKVKVNGEPEYYEVVGKPQKRQIIGYIKCVLKLEG